MKKFIKENWFCKRCKRITNYNEIEKNFELGIHTEKHPIIGAIPHVHKNCGGIVRPISKIAPE